MGSDVGGVVAGCAGGAGGLRPWGSDVGSVVARYACAWVQDVTVCACAGAGASGARIGAIAVTRSSIAISSGADSLRGFMLLAIVIKMWVMALGVG